jgi:hypothetical protein
MPLTAHQETIVGMTALQTADLLIAAGEELLDALDNQDREEPRVVGSGPRPAGMPTAEPAPSAVA